VPEQQSREEFENEEEEINSILNSSDIMFNQTQILTSLGSLYAFKKYNIFAFGGCSCKNGSALSSIEVYDSEENIWRVIDQGLVTKRLNSTLIRTPNETVVHIGGIGDKSNHMNSIEIFNTSAWVSQSLPIEMPKKISGSRGIYLDQSLYIAGGTDGHYIFKSAYRIDMQTN
jgi:N-acetylneuraminic acid mutarotase